MLTAKPLAITQKGHEMLKELKENYPILLIILIGGLLMVTVGLYDRSNRPNKKEELLILEIELKKLEIEKLKQELATAR